MILRSLDFKLHRAVNLGKQGVVTTHTDVVAGVELRTTLTNNDAASIDSCITKNLHTKTLSLGVTTVAGRTAALFMCHFLTLLEKSKLSRDRVDLELRVVLTMTSALDGVLATTHLEDANLVVTAVRNNRGRNAGAFNEGSTDLKFIAIGNSQDFRKGHLGADFGIQGFNLDRVTGSNAILLSAGLNNCVHCLLPRPFRSANALSAKPFYS